MVETSVGLVIVVGGGGTYRVDVVGIVTLVVATMVVDVVIVDVAVEKDVDSPPPFDTAEELPSIVVVI